MNDDVPFKDFRGQNMWYIDRILQNTARYLFFSRNVFLVNFIYIKITNMWRNHFWLVKKTKRIRICVFRIGKISNLVYRLRHYDTPATPILYDRVETMRVDPFQKALLISIVKIFRLTMKLQYIPSSSLHNLLPFFFFFFFFSISLVSHLSGLKLSGVAPSHTHTHTQTLRVFYLGVIKLLADFFFYRFLQEWPFKEKQNHLLGNEIVFQECKALPRDRIYLHIVISPELFFENKQSVPVNGLCVSWLRVLSFRVEVTEEKDTKVVPWKWFSDGK